MKSGERSAGIVPLRCTPDGWRVLGLRCFRNWDFPKGKLDSGEEPLQAALREAKEEADLGDLVLRWGEAHRETAPYGKGKVARYYLGETFARRSCSPSRPRWVTPSTTKVAG